MELPDYSLPQITPEYLEKLSPEELVHLSIKLVKDLKEARDRLNQNSRNSSRPSGSMEPWKKGGILDYGAEDVTESDEEIEEAGAEEIPVEEKTTQSKDDSRSEPEKRQATDSLTTDNPIAEIAPETAQPKKKNPPGKQVGAQGFGKTWNPAATEEAHHCHPQKCHCCAKALEESKRVAYTSFNQIDIQFGNDDQPGLVVTVTPFVLYEIPCACGHKNRYDPKAQPLEGQLWQGTQLSEWRSVGPNLAAHIVHLKMEFRLPIRKISGILSYFGIHLSPGLIQQCYEEVGASVACLEEPLQQALLQEALLHADETIWHEKTQNLWLWVFKTATVACYLVGGRTKKLFREFVKSHFNGWLMTDGYKAYRHYPKRLRCWAHLVRKTVGLKESTDKIAQEFGLLAHAFLESCMDAVYAWRRQLHPAEKTNVILQAQHTLLEAFKQACERYGGKEITHDKTRQLAREFLNDWDAIFTILEHPYLPLTNNEAERALRPWVLLRKICYGSRSPKGTKVFTLLASVIDTCRLRGVDSMRFLAQAISSARKGLSVPMIPVAVS